MIYLFKKTVFNCRQATLLSIKKDDGSITLLERVKLSYHLLYCDVCRRFINQSHEIDEVGRALNKPEIAYKLSSQTRERLQREIDELGK